MKKKKIQGMDKNEIFFPSSVVTEITSVEVGEKRNLLL